MMTMHERLLDRTIPASPRRGWKRASGLRRLAGVKRLDRGESGQVLLIVVIIMSLSVLMAVPITNVFSSTLRQGLSVHQDYQAEYSRDAGVEYAIATLKNTQSTRVTLSGQVGVPLALSLPPTAANGVSVTSLQATLLTPANYALVRGAPGGSGQAFAFALARLAGESPWAATRGLQLGAWPRDGGQALATRLVSTDRGNWLDQRPALLPRVTAVTVITASKTVSPTTVTPGGQVTYTITIQNPGGETASVTDVIDSISSGFGYVLNSTTGGMTSNPKVTGLTTLAWSPVPSIAAGGSLTFSFNVASTTTPGIYYNQVQVTGSNFTTVNTGNTAPVTVGPSMSVTKTVTPVVVVAGGNVTYTVTLANNSSGQTAHTTRFVDTLPSGFSYVTGSTTGAFTSNPSITGGVTLTWNVVLTVPYGSPASFSFQAASATAWGLHFNDIRAEGSDFATVATGPTAATTVGDIQITKTVDQANVNGGETITYTVTTRNVGSGTINIVRFEDVLASGFTYVTGSTSGAMTVNPSQVGNTLTWSGVGVPNSIAGGGQVVFSFRTVTPNNPGDYFNKATVVVSQPGGGPNQTVTTGDTAKVSVSSNAAIVISETQGNRSGPMGWSNVYVTGYSFAPNATVRLFWRDLNNPLNTSLAPPIGTDLQSGQTLVTLSSSYQPLSWAALQVTIPSNANWGNGFIVAVEQKTSSLWIERDRKAFNVRAKYLITSQTSDGKTVTARVAFTGAPSPDKAFSMPTNTPVITIYDWKLP
ncbi:MAG: DUF11 domain-containing protein [Dehalococcoidia bacterium]|nr:DUF11 domain-containing protein [Dehalococcoidia bacterium]